MSLYYEEPIKYPKTFVWIIIPKTIGNRKEDRNAQITTHISVSFTPHIVLICALQFLIFSGCVCHLENLHAQSPFLFPIVFGINSIPFFDICSVLAVPTCHVMVSMALTIQRRSSQGRKTSYGNERTVDLSTARLSGPWTNPRPARKTSKGRC